MSTLSPPRIQWPVVELLFEPNAGDDLAPLVRALASLVRPSAPDHANTVAARLLSSPTAPESALALRETHIPFAVVVRDASQLTHPVTEAATVVLTVGPPSLFDEAGDRAVRLSTHAIRTAEVLPVPPFTRPRLRAGSGLPDPFVLTVGRPGAPALGDAAIATALRLADVADVCGPSTIQALALGTPVVTDEVTAAALGAVDGTHLLVAAPSRSDSAARDLAADPTRAALLGRHGRILVELDHDPDVTARQLLARLGIALPAATPTAAGLRLADRLTELATPTGHPIELHFAERLADFGVAPHAGGSWR